MNSNFSNRLEEYLSDECGDYGMSFRWKWDEDNEICETTISCKYNENEKIINFRYDEGKDDLLIELHEDSWYVTREFDSSVKYFWMLVAPALFPDN